jgi:hypothetical protein
MKPLRRQPGGAQLGEPVLDQGLHLRRSAPGQLGAVAAVGARVGPAVDHDLVAPPGALARPGAGRPRPPGVAAAVARHQQTAGAAGALPRSRAGA